MVIRGNRTKTNERYRVRIGESLAKQLEALGAPAFPGTYPQWRERVNKAIKDAGVKTTPHGFRHYRITSVPGVPQSGVWLGTVPSTCSDFKIDRPSFLGIPISNEIQVHVDAIWHSQ